MYMHIFFIYIYQWQPAMVNSCMARDNGPSVRICIAWSCEMCLAQPQPRGARDDPFISDH